MMSEEKAQIPDVGDLSLAEIRRLNADPEVSGRLKQILTKLDDPNGVISAFQSFAADD